MNKIVLVLILVVILGAVLLLTEDTPYTGKPDSPDAIAALKTVDIDAVREISIRQKGDEILVARSRDGWIVPACWNYPANESVVQGFLSEVPRIREPEQRATSKASHATFEVDEEQGRHVRLVGEGAGLPTTFVLGKGDKMVRCFFRPSDSDTVYSIKSEILSKGYLYAEELVIRDWVERKIYDPPLDVDLVEFAMTTSDGVVRAKKLAPEAVAEGEEPPAPVWQVIEPETFIAEAGAIESFVSSVSRSQEAFDPVDPVATDHGLEAPERRAEFVFASGDRIVLLFGKIVVAGEGENADPAQYYVQREGDDRVFTMREWKCKRFFKSLDEFRPLPEEPVEEAAATSQPDE